jgi:sodium-coupled neutral amino acid transporter 11
MAFGIVAFAFVCHDSAFLLFNTLSRNTAPGRWAGVVHRSLCAALIVCLGLAVPGFLTFGASTCDNLLKNYEAGDPWIVAARAVYVLTMALTYPISFFVVRHIVNVWAYGGGPRFESVRTMPLSRHLALTLPLFVLSVGAAMLFEDLGPVMAVAGSLGGCTLAFILPPMCYLTLSRQSLLVWRNPNPWASLCDLGPPTCLLLFGLFMAPVCVWQTLASETLPCASAKHSGCPPK